MNKKINVIIMVLIIVVSSFCITTFSVNNKCEVATVISYSDDILYSEIATQSIETETINYSWKDTTTYLINSSFPDYYNTNISLKNACANVAGANIIGFYDRYYDNLIPDYTTGIQRANGYTYYPMILNKDKKQALIDLFYISMKTNTKNDGTSKDDCLNGLKSYIQSKGKETTYTSVIINGVFSLDKFDAKLREGNPVLLFLSGYNIVSLSNSGSEEILTKNVYAGNHIVVAYGYQKVDYYNSNNKLIKSNTYLYIATGIESVRGYYLINNGGNMDAAEAVAIN